MFESPPTHKKFLFILHLNILIELEVYFIVRFILQFITQKYIYQSNDPISKHSKKRNSLIQFTISKIAHKSETVPIWPPENTSRHPMPQIYIASRFARKFFMQYFGHRPLGALRAP